MVEHGIHQAIHTHPVHAKIYKKLWVKLYTDTPCSKFSQFCLFWDQKILSGIYNGGLWENVFESTLK